MLAVCGGAKVFVEAAEPHQSKLTETQESGGVQRSPSVDGFMSNSLFYDTHSRPLIEFNSSSSHQGGK